MTLARLKRSIGRRVATVRQRFETLQPRERLLIMTVGAVLVWAVAQLAYFNAASTKEKQIQQATSQGQQNLAELTAREQVVRAQLAEGSLAALQAKRAEIMRKRAELDMALEKQGLGLIDPERMRQVLRDLLEDTELRLMALRRLPSEPIHGSVKEPAHPSSNGAGSDAKQARDADRQDLVLYRHPIQIELEGRYVDMVHYLERLEASPWRLMWQDLDIETRSYPTVRMRLTVYTLSLQKEWVGV